MIKGPQPWDWVASVYCSWFHIGIKGQGSCILSRVWCSGVTYVAIVIDELLTILPWLLSNRISFDVVVSILKGLAMFCFRRSSYEECWVIYCCLRNGSQELFEWRWQVFLWIWKLRDLVSLTHTETSYQALIISLVYKEPNVFKMSLLLNNMNYYHLSPFFCFQKYN